MANRVSSGFWSQWLLTFLSQPKCHPWLEWTLFKDKKREVHLPGESHYWHFFLDWLLLAGPRMLSKCSSYDPSQYPSVWLKGPSSLDLKELPIYGREVLKDFPQRHCLRTWISECVWLGELHLKYAPTGMAELIFIINCNNYLYS